MNEKKWLDVYTKKLQQSEIDLESRLNSLKVRVVSEMIMNETISDYMYLEHLDNGIVEAEKKIKDNDDEMWYYKFTKKDNTKKLEEILSKNSREEIYRNACNSYYECCKFLYD